MVNVNFIGRIGRDAETKTAQNGRQFVTFNVATDEYQRGEKTTSWLRVTYTGERALKMAQYFTKGKLVNVIGSETVSTYQRQDGQIAIGRDVLADKVDFVNSGSGHTHDDQAAASADCGTLERPVAQTVPPTPAPAPTSNIPQQVAAVATPVEDDDDLPF